MTSAAIRWGITPLAFFVTLTQVEVSPASANGYNRSQTVAYIKGKVLGKSGNLPQHALFNAAIQSVSDHTLRDMAKTMQRVPRGWTGSYGKDGSMRLKIGSRAGDARLMIDHHGLYFYGETLSTTASSTARRTTDRGTGRSPAATARTFSGTKRSVRGTGDIRGQKPVLEFEDKAIKKELSFAAQMQVEAFSKRQQEIQHLNAQHIKAAGGLRVPVAVSIHEPSPAEKAADRRYERAFANYQSQEARKGLNRSVLPVAERLRAALRKLPGLSGWESFVERPNDWHKLHSLVNSYLSASIGTDNTPKSYAALVSSKFALANGMEISAKQLHDAGVTRNVVQKVVDEIIRVITDHDRAKQQTAVPWLEY